MRRTESGGAIWRSALLRARLNGNGPLPFAPTVRPTGTSARCDRQRRRSLQLWRAGAVDPRNERWTVLVEKTFDAVPGGNERMCKLRIRRAADDDEQPNVMPDHRFFLVGRVTNAAVVRERNPSPRSHLGEPLFVGGVWAEVVAMPFDREAGVSQDVGKTEAEVTIGEVDDQLRQPARTPALLPPPRPSARSRGQRLRHSLLHRCARGCCALPRTLRSRPGGRTRSADR